METFLKSDLVFVESQSSRRKKANYTVSMLLDELKQYKRSRIFYFTDYGKVLDVNRREDDILYDNINYYVPIKILTSSKEEVALFFVIPTTNSEDCKKERSSFILSEDFLDPEEIYESAKSRVEEFEDGVLKCEKDVENSGLTINKKSLVRLTRDLEAQINFQKKLEWTESGFLWSTIATLCPFLFQTHKVSKSIERIFAVERLFQDAEDRQKKLIKNNKASENSEKDAGVKHDLDSSGIAAASVEEIQKPLPQNEKSRRGL